MPDLTPRERELLSYAASCCECPDCASNIRAITADELALPEGEGDEAMDAARWRERNTPEIHDFLLATQREAVHQRERWGTDHDGGKEPEDWLWLVAYLATKATQANRYGDADKYLHHIITCAAACLNWHANANGDNAEMRPGTARTKA